MIVATVLPGLTSGSADGADSTAATVSQATSGATETAAAAAPVTVATQQVDGLGVVLTTAEG